MVRLVIVLCKPAIETYSALIVFLL